MNSVEKKRLRDEKILLTLDKLQYASRSQIQRIFSLGSDRNACRIMNNLKEYVHSFRHYENVFYLNKRGRERIGSDKVLSKPSNVEHHLLRNEVYIIYGFPRIWKIENPIKVRGENFITPDATFTQDDRSLYLVEVDRTQKMHKNIQKLRKYKEVKDLTPGKIFPHLIWITKTPSRKDKLEGACKDLGLDASVIVHSL